MALKLPVFNFPSISIELIIAASFFMVLFLIVYLFYRSVKPERTALYFSEADKIAEPLTVSEQSASSLFTECQKRIVRFRSAYNLKEGRKNITLWLVKRGIAYTHRLEGTPEGKAIKIGSLWKAICGILGDETAEKIKQDVKEKLMKSEVLVSVDIEQLDLAAEKLPFITEDLIKQDADMHMAEVFGEGAREGLSRRDMIRDIALMGSGIAVCFILQTLGILS